jgi:hypothetical protein
MGPNGGSVATDSGKNGTRAEEAIQCTLYVQVGCALVFASEAKIEIEAKISFRLEAKKRHDFACFTSKR